MTSYTYWHRHESHCEFARIPVSDRAAKQAAKAAGWERMTYIEANRHFFHDENVPSHYSAPIHDAAWFVTEGGTR